jgi:magnesium transporter
MEVLTAIDAGRIRQLRRSGTFFWLDLLEPTDDDLSKLCELIGIHPAAIEDTREWEQLPRLDDYGEYVLLIFFSARLLEKENVAEPVEVHVYMSGSWIVTARRCKTGLESQHHWLEMNEYEDEDQIVYHVLDALADGWDPVIDDLDRRVDTLETAVLARAARPQLETIYRLKQEVHELARRAGPQALNFAKAVETIHALKDLTRSSREWLRDVEVHVESVASDLHRLNADLQALTDTFFNATSYRLNRMATLVAIGSIFFLIWTLVTGFFGQNFGYLVRHIDTQHAFVAYEIGGLVIPTVVLGIVLWVRRSDWW